MTRKKYHSQILCISSLVYLVAGLIVIGKNPYLSALLLLVTISSILYHRNFNNLNFKTLDWVLGTVMFFYFFYLYISYLFKTKFDLFIFSVLLAICIFRTLDHGLFKTKHYNIFSYTHSLWHLISGVAIILILTTT